MTMRLADVVNARIQAMGQMRLSVKKTLVTDNVHSNATA
jgi:hypothetical protein